MGNINRENFSMNYINVNHLVRLYDEVMTVAASDSALSVIVVETLLTSLVVRQDILAGGFFVLWPTSLSTLTVLALIQE